MALINGNDYDHIDFTKNGVTTRHMLKDTLSRQMSGDLVKVQNEEPTSEGTKIWIKPSGDSEVQVPTYAEFEELSDKIDDADATIESLAVGAQPTVSVTDVNGHKRFSFGIPASNGIASITKTATDGVIDTYTIAMTDGTSTSFSVNNSDITPESMAEAIATALQDYARIDGYYPDLTAGNADQLNSTKFVENKEPYLYRPSGGTSDIGNRKYLDAIVGVSLPWNQIVRDEASENQTDFADILTITDAVEDSATLKVKIEPQQDLHGYDHPWPAGGGKNIVDFGTISPSTTNYAFQFSTPIPAGSYVLSFDVTDLSWSNSTDAAFAWIRYDSGTADMLFSSVKRVSDNASLKDLAQPVTGRFYVTVTSNAEGQYLIIAFRSNSYKMFTSGTMSNIMLESGTAPTDFAPYSNICPITGWTAAQVWDDPKHGGLIEWNQLASGKSPYTQNGISSIFSDGVYTFSGTTSASYTANIISVIILKGHKYFQLLTIVENPNELSFSVGSLNGGLENVNTETTSRIAESSLTKSVTVGASTFRTGVSVDGIKFKYILCDLTQMFGEGNEPSTVEEFKALFPADYYPYNEGEITTVGAVNGDPYKYYSITLPSEAGTVYGGELTVNKDGSGSLVVDMAKVDLPKTGWQVFEYSDNGDTFLYVTIRNFATGVITKLIKCNCLRPDSSVGKGTPKGYIALAQASGLIRCTPCDTVAEWENWLADNEAYIVYTLATPLTYTLTASEVTTLLGTNHIWADTGDVALTYTGTDEHLTLESGKKYIARINGTDSMLLGSAQEITAAKGTDNVFDLTRMFGTSVADYVYNQGAGYFRKWFGKTWYPYNTGELKHVEGLESHDVVGFNQWNSQLLELDENSGITINADGSITNLNTAYQENKNRYRIARSDKRIYLSFDATLLDSVYITSAAVSMVFVYTDGSRNTVVARGFSKIGEKLHFEGISNLNKIVDYVAFGHWAYSGTILFENICLHFVHNGSRNGEYEPYEKHSHPLDNTVILRGVPKVDSNGVYWDGDRYLPDGTVERRYGVVDLGTLNYASNTGIAHAYWTTLQNGLIVENEQIPSQLTNGYKSVSASRMNANDKCYRVYGTFSYGGFCRLMIKNTEWQDTNDAKAALSGVYLVYPITPTTEQALPYRNFQLVDDWGTEEFVTTGMIPVGHESRYPANLRDKLQHLPDAASSNGSYLITQTDGQMTLTPFPAPPTTAGKYALRATVTNGVATFTWEATT